MKYELGILGAGNMAEAIARGLIDHQVLPASQIIAADVSPERREVFQSKLGIHAVDNNLDVARQARAILLSVKPQQMKDALAGIGTVLQPDQLIVSIAAGISTSFIENNLQTTRPARVIRTMPNTPVLVGEGMVALSRGAHASADDLAAARRLFESSARVIEVEERLLDAVTAISGSGPAYVFFLVEQMIRAGIEMGLTPDHARLLAIQTTVGSAKMLASSTDAPQDLRRKVTSPGGTTHAAITHMETHALPAIIVEALHQAERRGKELGT